MAVVKDLSRTDTSSLEQGEFYMDKGCCEKTEICDLISFNQVHSMFNIFMQ